MIPKKIQYSLLSSLASPSPSLVKDSDRDDSPIPHQLYPQSANISPLCILIGHQSESNRPSHPGVFNGGGCLCPYPALWFQDVWTWGCLANGPSLPLQSCIIVYRDSTNSNTIAISIRWSRKRAPFFPSPPHSHVSSCLVPEQSRCRCNAQLHLICARRVQYARLGIETCLSVSVSVSGPAGCFCRALYAICEAECPSIRPVRNYPRIDCEYCPFGVHFADPQDQASMRRNPKVI